jgi:hypothetical protein
LPTAAVERDHELLPQALPQRLLFDELLKLGYEPIVATKREIRFDSVLETDEATFLQPFGLDNESLAADTSASAGPRHSDSAARSRLEATPAAPRASASFPWPSSSSKR